MWHLFFFNSINCANNWLVNKDICPSGNQFSSYFIRTNFRAFAQKSEKCAKISTIITRKMGMREN